MQVIHKKQNETLIISLVGELDEHTSNFTRTKIDKILAENDVGKVVFDCSGLSFMDSTGIGVFLGRYKKLKEEGVAIFIAHAKDSVDRVFNLSGIYNIMPKIS